MYHQMESFMRSQMSTFAAAIKLIPSGYDITKYPAGNSSLFSFCETVEQIDILIENKYSTGWSTPNVFKHITKIIGGPVDEILIKFIPLIVSWDKVYCVSTFYGGETSQLTHLNMIRMAVLLNSTKLLEKIIESNATTCAPSVSDLLFACDLARDDIIMLLMKHQPLQQNMEIVSGAVLHKYIMNGQNKQVVQILANKESIFWDDNSARIVAKFGALFMADLIRDLYTDTEHTDTTPTQYENDDLVDIYGNVICKDPAELAIAVFSRGNVLRRDEVHKVFIKPTKLVLTDIYGKKIVKDFINGLYIEIPVLSIDDDKIRFHMLTVHDKDMLVRFDKFRW